MTAQTSSSLEDLVRQAAQVYPDQFLLRQLEHYPPDDFATLKPEEALAAYLFNQFNDLYDSTSSTQANVERITASLERTSHLLGKVVQKLRELDGKTAGVTS